MRTLFCIAILMLTVALTISPTTSRAQSTTQSIYSDELDNGYQDWSWATHSLTNTSPVYAGNYSISLTLSAWTALFLHNSDESTVPFTALQFYVNGGATGGQQFVVAAIGDTNTVLGEVPISQYVTGGTIPANTWVKVTIPLSALGAADVSNFSGIWLQDSTGGNQSTLYLDNISLLGAAVPTNVTATVNYSQVIQTVDNHVYGINTAIWDSDFDSSTVIKLLGQTACASFRYPGGSDSDSFDWTASQWNGMPMTKDLFTLTSALNAHTYITLNYGSGTPQMAEAWAAYCDALPTSTLSIGVDSTGRNWYTAGYWASLRAAAPLATDDGLNILRANHPASFNWSVFEVGNECYGSWENDTHTKQQDPVIYAQFYKTTRALIKLIQPSAVVGAVITGDEDSWGNQTETVTNPVTGVQHSGWTAVLFSTLKSLGVAPDFVIYHNYPQGPGSESDYQLLHNASNWTGVATSIRTMLTDYFGTSASATTLACTENNSVSYNPGKQTTSLVNGLYYADSVGSLLTTEFHTLMWWNLHNGVQTGDNNSSALYGWRQYGDYGMLASGGGTQPGSAQDTPYPTFMAAELFRYYATYGDSVLSTSTSYQDLSVYASKNSANDLKLLVINKNPTASFTTTINYAGYVPSSSAKEFSYGLTQDTAQQNGTAAALAVKGVAVSGSSLTQIFPPYSMTVIQLTPAS